MDPRVVIVAADGSIIASLMAHPDDPELRNRYPDGSRFIAPPQDVYPNTSWKYDDARGFIPPTNVPQSAKPQIDF